MSDTLIVDTYEPHRAGLHSDDRPYPGEPMCYCDKPKEVAVDNIELREKLASIEHERWSDWQKWVHERVCYKQEDGGLWIPPNHVEHWNKQIETPYAELSDKEKASDMEQVDRYWPLIESYVQEQQKALIIRALEAGDGETWDSQMAGTCGFLAKELNRLEELTHE